MINALMTGDVWLAPSLFCKRREIKNAFSEIVENRKLDLFICNLEAPFASEKLRGNRRTIINTEPSLLKFLKVADKNILILANNHLNDFGNDGFGKRTGSTKARIIL